MFVLFDNKTKQKNHMAKASFSTYNKTYITKNTGAFKYNNLLKGWGRGTYEHPRSNINGRSANRANK